MLVRYPYYITIVMTSLVYIAQFNTAHVNTNCSASFFVCTTLEVILVRKFQKFMYLDHKLWVSIHKQMSWKSCTIIQQSLFLSALARGIESPMNLGLSFYVYNIMYVCMYVCMSVTHWYACAYRLTLWRIECRSRVAATRKRKKWDFANDEVNRAKAKFPRSRSRESNERWLAESNHIDL